MTKLTAAALLFATLALSACNTATGLVQDTYGAGKFVVNQITDDD